MRRRTLVSAAAKDAGGKFHTGWALEETEPCNPKQQLEEGRRSVSRTCKPIFFGLAGRNAERVGSLEEAEPGSNPVVATRGRQETISGALSSLDYRDDNLRKRRRGAVTPASSLITFLLLCIQQLHFLLLIINTSI